MKTILALRDVVLGKLISCSCYFCCPWFMSSDKYVCWSTCKSLWAHTNLMHSVCVNLNLGHLRNRVVTKVIDYLSRSWVVWPAGVSYMLRLGSFYCVE